jgi:hypothetical protein
MKRIVCLLILCFAFFASHQTARAQEFLYSIAYLDQFGNPADPNSVMAGYSVTGMTYGMALYYNSVQVSTLVRDGVEVVAQGVSENFPYTVNYTAASIVPGSVYTQFTDTGTRIIDFVPCGNPWDAYGLSFYAYLPYSETNQWPPFPSICVVSQLLYLGYTAAQQQATQPNPPCQDTCKSCKRDRRNRFILCATAGGACGVAAYTAYAAGINDCENQAICNPASPMFNQQQCDNCKENKDLIFISALTACGAAGTTCLLTTLPDCSVGKNRCDANGNPVPGCP